MKRSDALAPLSRDHQHALAAALRLRRADDESVAPAVAAFDEFWRSAGERHFEIEEELILPALSTDDGDWERAVTRVRDDHAAIRERAATLSDAVTPARELGELLNDHVRFEERELFVLLEQRLPPDELARLGRDVEAAEAR